MNIAWTLSSLRNVELSERYLALLVDAQRSFARGNNVRARLLCNIILLDCKRRGVSIKGVNLPTTYEIADETSSDREGVSFYRSV